MDDLLRWRGEFPILSTTTYLISNSLGAMPSRTKGRLMDYAAAWETQGVTAWHDSWWEMTGKIGDKVSPIIGVDPGTVSMHLNITTTEAIIASCFDFTGPRNKVVYSDMNFPSVHYFWQTQKRVGADVHIVPTRDGITVDTQEMCDAIDESTLLVPMSHVLFRSAYIQDARAIIEKAHSVGAFVALDVYQSAGVVPIHANDWDADFVLGGTLKWLCGGPGVAFLYVRPDLAKTLKPRITGWLAHPQPFDFDMHAYKPVEDQYRFLNGTPNIPGLYACEAGLDIINAVGVDRIRENSLRQTARLIDMADERGWKVTAPREAAKRGGTVAFDVPDGLQVCEQLIAREILVDYRPKAGVRVSPHFYNTDDEMDRFFAATEEILACS